MLDEYENSSNDEMLHFLDDVLFSSDRRNRSILVSTYTDLCTELLRSYGWNDDDIVEWIIDNTKE